VAKRKKTEQRDAMNLFGYRGGGDKPRKKQVITYDKAGNVLGDDGYEMTPTRKRMHRIFDAWFIYLFIMVVAAIALMILGYFQGAQYSDWEIVQRGGNQFNGWDTALLIRLEALLCLFTAVFSALINFFGFRWFYDRKPVGPVYAMMIVLGLACVGYLAFGIMGVGAIEPLSLVNISFMLVTLITMSAVKAERPTLRKPKVGKRVVK
jgi:hypothetical protein